METDRSERALTGEQLALAGTSAFQVRIPICYNSAHTPCICARLSVVAASLQTLEIVTSYGAHGRQLPLRVPHLVASTAATVQHIVDYVGPAPSLSLDTIRR